jgi:hypothetical protein
MRNASTFASIVLAIILSAFACRDDSVEIIVINKSGQLARQVTVSCQQVTQIIDSVSLNEEVKLRFPSANMKALGKFVLITATARLKDTIKVEGTDYNDALTVPFDRYFIVIDSAKLTIGTKRS